MSIESITSKILAEAQDYAKEKMAEAEAAKAEALEEASRKAAEIVAKRAEDAEKDGKALEERRSLVADLDARKMRLAAKQEIIDECFDEALDQLANNRQDDYVSFILAQISTYADQEGEVLLNAQDLAGCKAELEKALAGSKLTISEEPVKIKGGCIIRQGNISYNASVEKLLESVKADMIKDIADELFAE